MSGAASGGVPWWPGTRATLEKNVVQFIQFYFIDWLRKMKSSASGYIFEVDVQSTSKVYLDSDYFI